MKIPGGYGWVRIGLHAGGVYYKDFRNISDNPVIPHEISTTYIDVNDNVQKHIRGYHLEFNLQLVDKYIASGSQNGLVDFMRLYHSGNYSHADRRISIYPNYDSSGSGWNAVMPYAYYWAVLKDAPDITDICDFKFTGQILNIKARTRELITEDEYKVRIYRESSSGAWGLYNAPQQGYIEPAIGVR